MVLFKSTLLGIALLVAGVLMLSVVGQYVTMDVQQVQRHDIDTKVQFLVGDSAERDYPFSAGSPVFGSVGVTEALSNQSSDIQFKVFDQENYNKWKSTGQAETLIATPIQGTENYTFTAGKTGSYHFVFDNQASLSKKFVTFSVSYNEITTTRVPDPRMNYLTWACFIAGALILVYGLATKPPAIWAG
jgi:hypothetical protein